MPGYNLIEKFGSANISHRIETVLKTKVAPGQIAALVLALFAFGLALHVNRTTFERLPHLEDEYAYLFQAKVFAGGHLWVDRPADVEVKVLWQPFVLQPDTPTDGVLKRFGKYTPGWPLALAIGILLNAPWIVNAALAALTVALVYRIGREIFDEAVGLVAALLMAISPMAILLSATLMSHTSALFCTMLFIYSYWRLTKADRRWRTLIGWGIVAGLAIGWVAMTRPLTAVAMAAPVGLHALSRLLDLSGLFANADQRRKALRVVLPMIVLALAALPLVGSIFIFNHAVTGEWRSELYSLQWPYDKVGFGEGYGLMGGGHTLEFGWTNARADLSIWLRDLFGWTLDPGLTDYVHHNFGWGAGVGLSWLLLIIGLIAGYRSEWIWLFFELLIAIILAQLTYWIGSSVYGSAVYSVRYYFEATGGVVLVAAYGFVALARGLRTRSPYFTLFFLTVMAIALVIWLSVAQGTLDLDAAFRILQYLLLALILIVIGGLFSTFEKASNTFLRGLSAAWAALWPGYIILAALAGATIFGYVPTRLAEPLRDWPLGLYRYNEVGQQEIDALNAIRDPNKPVLVVVLDSPATGADDNWRDYGALMAETSPYLNSDIVVARVFDPIIAEKFVQRFPDRQVLYEIGTKLYYTAQEALQANTPGNDGSGKS